MIKGNIAQKETLTRGKEILKRLGIVVKPVNTVQELIEAKNYCGTFGTPNKKRLTVK